MYVPPIFRRDGRAGLDHLGDLDRIDRLGAACTNRLRSYHVAPWRAPDFALGFRSWVETGTMRLDERRHQDE
jgi:hypothetical protein